jgi:PKD repeat protein
MLGRSDRAAMALGLLLVIAGAVPTACERGADAPPETSLVASFTYSPSLPVEGQTVQFTDTSTGHPTRWQWDFGNGGTSPLQNPSWTFAAAGTSRVTLTVAAASLESTAAKDVVISPASANVHEAASVSLADVRAAVESAHSGDIVRLPAGTAVWTGQLTVSKSVSLIGAGIGLTTIKGGFSGTLFQSNDCLIAYDVTDDPIRIFRISGLSLDGEGRCEPLFIINTHAAGSPIRIRIDHCDFDDLRGDGTTGWITSWGTVYGVVDDCVFRDSADKNGVSTICPYGSNDVSWTFTAFEFGNADNLYYEDNVFYFKDQVFQGGAGGRVAVRHNTFNFIGPSTGGTVQFIDVHGNYLGGNHSSFGVELYDNTVNMGGRPVQMVDLRGGKALFYDNHFENCGSYISSQFREESGSYRGHDANNPPAVDPLNGQTQHISDTYLWNIYRNGVKYIHGENLPYIGDTINYADPTGIDYRPAYASYGVVPREDVHFWREKTAFDGSSGMGSGSLSARPAACTLEGAGYWVPDERTLYRWHSGAWQAFYRPLAYPHPLRTALSD